MADIAAKTEALSVADLIAERCAKAGVEITPELQKRFDLARSVGEECIQDAELMCLLGKKQTPPICYDGFEPSGRMHIAQGVFKAMNVNKLTQAGCKFVFWVADWFALMNDKMGGDLDKIQVVGRYLIEVWKAAGMVLDNVEFVWCAQAITDNADQYWTHALSVARAFNLTRIKKCCQIMGRMEGNLTAAQILYPLMQCTDIFFLKADICQLGVDQRKVNMLAREYCDAVKLKLKPIILSHHMLYGLKQGQEKMSKSDPDSAIFMEDSEEDVLRKIMQAHCPVTKVDDAVPKAEVTDAGLESMHLVEDNLANPCLDYVEHIVFSSEGATFEANGTTYTDANAVKTALVSGVLPPDELKRALAAKINQLLEPVRAHFRDNAEAAELLSKVRSFSKEPAPKSSRARRMVLPCDKPIHLVFAPWADGHIDLVTLFNLAHHLLAAPEGTEKVLWLSDWGSFVRGAFPGAKDPFKVISLVYSTMVKALNIMVPHAMEGVRIVSQKEAIVAAPGNYWISVINAGRAHQLEAIHALEPQADGAGHVVAALMRMADVLSCAPASVACALPLDHHAAGYARDLLAETDTPCKACELALPIDRCILKQLEGDQLASLTDDYLLLLDSQQDTGKKIKRAFCQPGNVEFNPVISLAALLLANPAVGVISISRKEENGGNKDYTTVDSIKEDFVSEALHPGDLKPAVVAGVEKLMQPFRALLKSDKEVKETEKQIQAWAKKMKK